MSKENVVIENVRFAVLDRPICVWSPFLEKTNLEFLKGVDPNFFTYQAKAHLSVLDLEREGQAALHAAPALRLAYGTALESLFAFLGAVMQAPDCVFGWLSSYRNSELDELVRRISAGSGIKTLRPFRPATWERVSDILLAPLKAHDEDKYARVSALFARAWRQFAHEFTNELHSREYNSLKHGFRVQPSSFTIDITHQDRSLLQSKSPFGHRFPFVRPMPERRAHRNVSYATLNLEPKAYAAGLSIVAMSITNAVAFAKARAGDDPEKATIQFPENDEVFEALWKPEAAISSLTYGGSISVAPEEYWSDKDILAIYEDADDAPDVPVAREEDEQ